MRKSKRALEENDKRRWWGGNKTEGRGRDDGYEELTDAQSLSI